jgi:putative flippase GtrA
MRARIEEAVRFVLVGIVNTFVGLSVIYLLKWSVALGDVGANAVGYVVGLAVSFVLNRNWTFRHSGKVMPAVARFVMVFAVAYAVNLATVLTLIKLAGVNAYLAQALGVPPYTILFFLGSRYFAFRDPAARVQA